MHVCDFTLISIEKGKGSEGGLMSKCLVIFTVTKVTRKEYNSAGSLVIITDFLTK